MTYAYGVEQTVGRSTRLDRVLTELLVQVPEIEAASVVSFDGLAMASALPEGMDEDRVAAMSAALLSLGERAAEGLGRGALSQVYVEGESGTVFLISADDEAVLVAVGAKGAKVGLMLFEVRRAAEAVADVLRAEPLVLDGDDEVDAGFAAVDEAVQPAYDEPEFEEAVYAAAGSAPFGAGDSDDSGDSDDAGDPAAYDEPVADHDDQDEPAYEPTYAEAMFGGAAYGDAHEPHAVPAALQSPHEPVYQPSVTAYEASTPRQPVATGTPSSASWYAPDTILPGGGSATTDAANWS